MRKTLKILLVFTVCKRQVYWNSVLMRFMDDLLALDSIVHFGFSDQRLELTATFSISTYSDTGMMKSCCSCDTPIVNISESATNKAFQALEDSPNLEPSLDHLHKLYAPPFVILKPDSILHARIEVK
ncbi:hypothetical protein Tco_1535251 [Tanacetum coccineum]